jgi:D-alanyl-D-alanine carboxypeptidase
MATGAAEVATNRNWLNLADKIAADFVLIRHLLVMADWRFPQQTSAAPLIQILRLFYHPAINTLRGPPDSVYRHLGLGHKEYALTGTRFTQHLSTTRSLASVLLTSLMLAACQTSDVLDAKKAVERSQPERYASVVIDMSSGKELYGYSQNAVRYPASLTKMMTLYLVFEALQSGQIDKTTLMAISANAARQAPSKIGLKPGETIDVDTAIRAITVKSANDIAVAFAEYLAGSEEAFAARMTAKARAIGMGRTTFRNASGLHDPAQVTTAEDMARLGVALRRRFPQHFSYFGLKQFSVAGRTVTGHNKVLDTVAGANGIKTGYTRASGFNLVTSVERDGKQMIAVILGEDSARARDARMAALVMAYMGRMN